MSHLAIALLLSAGLHQVDEAGYRAIVASHHGHALLVDFWATWCEPCREELPKLAALRGIRLATVSCDEPEKTDAALKFLRASHVRGPFFIKRAGEEERFIDSIDPHWSGALPALFLYDRDGRLKRSFIGEVEIADVEAAIRKLL